MIAHVIDNVPLCTLLRLSSYTDRMYVSAAATAPLIEQLPSSVCVCFSVRSYLSTWQTWDISVIYLCNQIGKEATSRRTYIRNWDNSSKWQCDYTNAFENFVVWNANAQHANANAKNANANANANSCIAYNNSTGTLYTLDTDLGVYIQTLTLKFIK
jgi:hypothetical protein